MDDAAHIHSPCVGICVLDVTGEVCVGCRRTTDEIAGWGGYTPAEKHAVLDRIAARPAPSRTHDSDPRR